MPKGNQIQLHATKFAQLCLLLSLTLSGCFGMHGRSTLETGSTPHLVDDRNLLASGGGGGNGAAYSGHGLGLALEAGIPLIELSRDYQCGNPGDALVQNHFFSLADPPVTSRDPLLIRQEACAVQRQPVVDYVASIMPFGEAWISGEIPTGPNRLVAAQSRLWMQWGQGPGHEPTPLPGPDFSGSSPLGFCTFVNPHPPESTSFNAFAYEIHLSQLLPSPSRPNGPDAQPAAFVYLFGVQGSGNDPEAHREVRGIFHMQWLKPTRVGDQLKLDGFFNLFHLSVRTESPESGGPMTEASIRINTVGAEGFVNLVGTCSAGIENRLRPVP